MRSSFGSHRFVLDYLLEEVLRQQPAPIRQFLLRTALLDRLCGPLCDVILDVPPGAGQATLHAIERANLFLIPLDDERCWYRYHDLQASKDGGELAALDLLDKVAPLCQEPRPQPAPRRGAQGAGTAAAGQPSPPRSPELQRAA